MAKRISKKLQEQGVQEIKRSDIKIPKVISEQPKTLLGPKPKKEKEVKQKYSSRLFDLMKGMFGNEKLYTTYDDYEKSSLSFMINRYMAIKFPLNADKLNQLKYNQTKDIITIWKLFLQYQGHNNGVIPGWVWNNIKKQKMAKEYIPKEDVAKKYRDIHQIDLKTFKEILTRFPNELKNELDELEEFLN